MPELPEVETVRLTLKELVLNKKIIAFKAIYPRIIDGDVDSFSKAIINKRIIDIKRRGKFLIFELEDNITFYSHLRMEGKFFVQKKDEPINKHIHIIFEFDDGIELRYQDTRKFGRMGIIERSDYRIFKNLGPEPFSADFNFDYVKNYLKNKNVPMKTVLLSQDFVAGIGNIYADEILFFMRINPHTKANKLSDEDIYHLIEGTKEIFNKAIKLGGTTIRSYTSSLGVTGRFQNELNIHTQTNCPICDREVTKDKIGGRGTYYCDKCQVLK